ncbi:hypothetical protein JCM8097_003559 [Rhodosporidiobolus ruineniae]
MLTRSSSLLASCPGGLPGGGGGALESHKQQQQQQQQQDKQHEALPVDAQVPNSPLFGAGEQLFGTAGEVSGGGEFAFGGGQGEHSHFLLPRLTLRDMFPASPPYLSDQEDEEDDVDSPSSSPSFSSPAPPDSSSSDIPTFPFDQAIPTFPFDQAIYPPSLALFPEPVVSSKASFANPDPLLPLAAPYTLDEDTKALLADLLTTQGLDEYTLPALASESAPVVPVERPVPSAVPSSINSTSTTTYGHGEQFSNPQARALSFDAQLASPLFDPVSDDFDYSPYLGYTDFASPSGVGAFDPSASAQCSPLWSDLGGAVSPAALCSPSAGPSPSMGTVELFSSFGLGPGNADGAYFTSTSRPATAATAATADEVPLQLFSPVVHPVPDLGALGLDQISPSFLPAALPLPAVVPAPAADSSASSSPSIKLEADADAPLSTSTTLSPVEEDPLDADSADGEWLPCASPPRASSVGPVRSSRRTSSSASKTSAPTGVKPPLPGLKVALDAPITRRVYSAPNARTAKKAIPRNLQKKIDAARARGEDVDEDEYVREADRKRAANTLSARQSRMKKAERVAELEATERRYVEERAEWEEERRGLVRRIEELEEMVGAVEGAKKRRRVE